MSSAVSKERAKYLLRQGETVGTEGVRLHTVRGIVVKNCQRYCLHCQDFISMKDAVVLIDSYDGWQEYSKTLPSA